MKHLLSRLLRALLILLLLLQWTMPAWSATHTWKGGGGDNYSSNEDNWIGGAPEENEPGGTVLVFPASAQAYVRVCVNLTGVSLLAALGSQPQTGAKFVIIQNDGTEAVTGQFTRLAEGGNVNISGKPFSISYHGGDGKDVELRYLGTGGPPRTLMVSYNRTLDHWQVSSTTANGSNFATGTPNAAGLLKLDQTIGLNAERLSFRLVQP